jgi:hypothetical protein
MRGSVHFWGALLEYAMEMQARRLIPQLVVDIDDNLVADCGFDGWARPLPIDTCQY